MIIIIIIVIKFNGWKINNDNNLKFTRTLQTISEQNRCIIVIIIIIIVVVCVCVCGVGGGARRG